MKRMIYVRMCAFERPFKLNLALLFLLQPWLLIAGEVFSEGKTILKVNGNIKYTAYGEKGAFPPSDKIFTCWIDECGWSVVIANQGAMTNIIQRHEFVYTGDSVFSLEVHGSAGLEKLKKTKTTDEISRLVHFRDVGIVMPGMVPFSETAVEIGPIWFAFCSACYLDSRGEAGLKPIWATRPKLFKESNYAFSANVTRAAAKPCLPAFVEFVSDGKLYDSTGMKYVQYNPFTNAVFSASNFVNVGGVSIPKHFRLTLYKPILTKAGVEGFKVACEWEGAVADAAIDPNIKVIALPQITANTQVKDYRPQIETKLGRIDYGITNGSWVSVGDPIMAKAERRAKQIDGRMVVASRESGNRKIVVRIAILTALVGSLVVFALLLMKNFGRNTLKQNQTKPN